MNRLLSLLGPEIVDPEEEAFLLFSQSIPSNSLGFVHNKAEVLDISIGGKDYAIQQSPGLLNSNRKEGTTGAVLWQVTPRFSEWICSSSNFLFTEGILNGDSNVLELGCGVSGLLGLVLSSKVKTYIATDQAYTLKFLKSNLVQNLAGTVKAKKPSKSRLILKGNQGSEDAFGNIKVIPLDWETDSVSTLYSDVGLKEAQDRLHAVIACDCIYNESLIDPFVTTCVDICSLSPSDSVTICIVAQQLRSPDVFENWLQAFHSRFHTWRVPDDKVSADLGQDSGFVVHIGLLREKS